MGYKLAPGHMERNVIQGREKRFEAHDDERSSFDVYSENSRYTSMKKAPSSRSTCNLRRKARPPYKHAPLACTTLTVWLAPNPIRSVACHKEAGKKELAAKGASDFL